MEMMIDELYCSVRLELDRRLACIRNIAGTTLVDSTLHFA